MPTPAIAANTRQRTGYLPTLDGWRTIAIGLVFCAHMKSWPGPLAHIKRFINPYGYLGVDIFFAISGLLICHRLLEEERICGRISLKGFYIRRSFRIFPPAFLYLGVIAVLGFAHRLPTAWPTWWSALLFLRNYAAIPFTDDAQNLYTAHFWSLAVEEHFYLLLPALLVFLPRWRKQALFGLTALALIWIGLYAAITPWHVRPYLWTRRTDLHIASLLFPAWLALVLFTDSARERLRSYLHPGLVLAGVAIACAGIVGLHHAIRNHAIRAHKVQVEVTESYGGSITVTTDTAGHTIEHISQRYGGIESPVYTFAVPLLFPFLVLSTMLRPESWIGRFLELPAMRWIGRLSYSLYLWQQLFWDGRATSWPIYVLQHHQAVGIALTFATAIASFYLLERPCIRIGHRVAPPATPGHRDTPTTLDAVA